MSRKPKIRKSVKVRFAELEDHLYFLREARRQYSDKREHYKQLVTELRVLVGDHKPDRRLLLAMMDAFGFRVFVQPPGPPREKQPITMVGWLDDPAYKALADEAAAAHGDPEKLKIVLSKKAVLRRPVPFHEFVEKAQAVYIKPYEYSYLQLVQSVSQQIGSSHEDTSIDLPLAQMQNLEIGGAESFQLPLVNFADLVLKVGMQLLLQVRKHYGYEFRHFTEVLGEK